MNVSEERLKEIILEELENYLDENLLVEKCWPGYEKRGMKKMFGKMYPNCVKKSKKKGKKRKKNERMKM